MEESCLFYSVCAARDFLLYHLCTASNKHFFDKESVFPHTLYARSAKRRSLRLFQLLQRFLHRVRRERNTPASLYTSTCPQWNAARSLS